LVGVRLALAAALTLHAACIQPELVTCSDGLACAHGKACDEAHHSCVSPDQLTACASLPDFTSCTATGVPDGRCFDGVCLPRGCGNGFVEPEELCDDGNQVGGDGCSADCLSEERCGDGYVDHQRGEECDDGNALNRDGCTSACTLEDFVWRYHGGAPPARQVPALAYDLARRQMVGFGGSVGTKALNDTWVWDGTNWIDVTPTNSPDPRSAAAMAYDPARHRIVLFGGFIYPLGWLNDTWEWDGVSWQRMHPTTQPAPRSSHAMVWDGHSILMFGGKTAFGSFDDTWRWDGVDWKQLDTPIKPGARAGHAMAFDAAHDRTVVYGGTGSSQYFDTWTFDGTSWSLLSGPGPNLTGSLAAVFDPVRRVVVLSGAVSTVQHTWELDDLTWRNTGATAVPNTLGYAAAYDLELQRVVQWAGDVSGVEVADLWAWDPDAAAWSIVTPEASPPARQWGALAHDPKRGRTVMFGGYAASIFTPPTVRGDLWEWDGRQWVLISPVGNKPTPRYGVSSVYDGVSDRVLVIGGTLDGSAGFGEMWSWDGTSWSQYTAATPPARSFAAIAYDPDRRRVVLFGGTSDGTTPIDDTWEWDGTSWTQATPTTSPAARLLSAMAYDAVHKRMVLFGGSSDSDSVGVMNDTWAWDGTTWTELDPATIPDARADHALVYDRARRRIEMFGGGLAVFSPWEWTGDDWIQVAPVRAPQLRYGPLATYDSTRREIVQFGGSIVVNTVDTTWTGSYAGVPDEVCDSGVDVDGDGATGCADNDCVFACEPACLGGDPCTDGPRCGDGTCSAIESERSCPADCSADPICGDGFCSPGEVCSADC
jgi:cysteine-rich repeat protein